MAFNASRLISSPQITPKASPHHLKPSSSRSSPTRSLRSEQLLNLKQVIGTTATSNNGFDCLQNGSMFAFIAGSGAVLAHLNNESQVSQRFFRARPSTSPLNASPSIYDSPTPAGPSQTIRSRTAASLRESAFGLPGSPLNDYCDSPGVKSSVRAKATTSVALSPDGRFIALGETGHKPRVLIFSTAKDAPNDIPLAAMSEHTFGVRCLAFSPDSQYLASLGDMNDGFLYIWNINQRTGGVTLHSSNKCTTNIKQIRWMGNSLITVGTRHVKVWRVEDGIPERASPSKRVSDISFAFQSPASRALSGRNCLLGSLLDKTFTSIAVISPKEAIVCTEQGDICILKDTENPPKFYRVANVGFPIGNVAVNASKQAIFAGSQGQLQTLGVENLLGTQTSWVSEQLSQVHLSNDQEDFGQGILALSFLDNRLIIINNQRSLKILDPVNGSDGEISYTIFHHFAAHGAAVLGIQAFSKQEQNKSRFLTWSADGIVLFWTSAGSCENELKVDLEQTTQFHEDYINELKIVRAFDHGKYLSTGDRFGIIRVINIDTKQCVFETRAHSNEVTDIAIYEGDQTMLIATAARDRTIQLFCWNDNNCEHIQTVEEHTGAVTGLLFSEDGERLISCSSDRTVLIMEAVLATKESLKVAGFLPCRPITLKATPISMNMVFNETLIISTIDRNILRYDLSSGNLLSSFRATDQEGGDAVVLNSITHIHRPKRSSLIAGVSGTDKSIRLYDEAGKLLEREFGHTEGMTGISVVCSTQSQSSDCLVTVATDGTVFVWDLSLAQDQLCDLLGSMDLSSETLKSSQLFASRPPLRKVISSSELLKLHGVKEEPEDAQSRESETSTPPVTERPALKKRPSRLSMLQTPKLDPTVGRLSQTPVESSIGDRTSRRASTIGRLSPENGRRYSQTVRSSSRAPPPQKTTRSLRKSLSSSNLGEDSYNSRPISTDTVCRNLHSFRKQIAQSTNPISVEDARELEKELSLTAKLLAEKSRRKETAVARLLDQYSEKFLELLEGRIEQSVERHVRVQGNYPEGLESLPKDLSVEKLAGAILESESINSNDTMTVGV